MDFGDYVVTEAGMLGRRRGSEDDLEVDCGLPSHEHRLGGHLDFGHLAGGFSLRLGEVWASLGQWGGGRWAVHGLSSVGG